METASFEAVKDRDQAGSGHVAIARRNGDRFFRSGEANTWDEETPPPPRAAMETASFEAVKQC